MEALVELDQNESEAVEIERIVDEVAQEMANRAVEQLSKQQARSLDENFIIRRSGGTRPADPEMRAAWDEANETAHRAADAAVQKLAGEAAIRAYDEAYKRALKWAYGEPSTMPEELRVEAAHNMAKEAAEGARDEAYERTRERVEYEVWSMMFPREFRKAMLRRRPRAGAC
jgi:hypothetical protein